MVHGVAAGVLLGGVAFDEGGDVDGVGEGELGKVARGVVFSFVDGEAGWRWVSIRGKEGMGEVTDGLPLMPFRLRPP